MELSVAVRKPFSTAGATAPELDQRSRTKKTEEEGKQ
jgi:hypothetical protein